MKNTMLFLLLLSPLASSAEPMPKCFDGTNEIQPMNETVVQYKQTMPNLRKFQVLVKATLVKMMPNTTNAFGTHEHFIVSLRDDTSDPAGQIEIAHSMNEYTAPSESDLRAGPVFLCGEYSTTNANGIPKITKFIPSVTGAEIHWTHQATNSLDAPVGGHPNGWIYANGKVFGRFASKPL
jgi:hypothetical protein